MDKMNLDENNELNENDNELMNLFSKHLQNDSKIISNKQKIDFSTSEVFNNKKELKQFQNFDLIKKQIHFSLDDKETMNSDDEDINFNNDIPNDKNNKIKDKNYFKDVMNDTMKNENLYCSYLDHFDKIWANNKTTKNNNILSCAGCFNQISFESENVKYFTNVKICQNLIQDKIFIDFLETYNLDKFIELLNEWIKTNDDEKIFSNNKEEKLKELGIDLENDYNITQAAIYVSVKCSYCYLLLGVYDSLKKQFIIFNSI